VSAVILSSIGTFELLLAIGQFFIVVIAILLIVSLFILRSREPDLPRPFAPTPILMRRCDARLRSASILRLYRQPYPSLHTLILLAASYPLFRLRRAQASS
jgi:hypothetical protein